MRTCPPSPIHNIFLIKCSPVSSFRQFVYHILSFSTVEFGIQFLISCILSSCHCFLSIRFVFSVVSQVFCCSTALPLLETISLILHCFLHIIIPPPGLPFYILATRCFSKYLFCIGVNHVANVFPCGFFLLFSFSHMFC